MLFRSMATSANHDFGVFVINAVTYDGTDVVFYRDGSLVTTVGTEASGNTDYTGITDIFIGGRAGGTNSSFDGVVPFISLEWSVLSEAAMTEAQCQVSAMAWDYRGIPVFGGDSTCSEYDLTAAPLYAQGFDVQRDAMGWVLAHLQPPGGLIQ